MKSVLPLVSENTGNYSMLTSEDVTMMYHNVSPVATGIDNDYSLSVRPSLGTVTTTASIDDNSRGRGIADFKGYDLMLVNDDTWYYSGGSTEIYVATPFDKESLAKFTLYSQAGSDRLVLVNAGAISTAGTEDGSIWFKTAITGAPTEIADADAPGYNGNSLCRGGVSLDGYFFVGDILGNIMNCNLDDITTWVSTSLVVAEREADTGIYIGKHRDHVFFLGTRSLEFFYNAANTAPASPLTRRADMFHNVGCYHPNSVLELGDITYFIGKAQSGEVGLFQLTEFGLNIVGSHPIIDKLLRQLSYQEPDITAGTDLEQGVYLAAFNSQRNGQFLVLTLPGNGTFAIHLKSQTWAKWYLGGTPANNGGITDWTSPKIFPLTASLNRPGADSGEPNRYLLLNGLVSSEFVITGAVQYANKGVYDFSAEMGASSLWQVVLAKSGTKAYINDALSNSKIFEYDLSTPYNLKTATYTGNTITIQIFRHMIFSLDGTHFWTQNGGNSTIKKYDMSVAWDISTTTQDTGVSIDPSGVNNTFFTFGNSGNYLFVGWGNSQNIVRFTLSTPYDIRTLPTSAQDFFQTTSSGITQLTGSCLGMAFEPDGLTMYLMDDNIDTIEIFTLTTAWDFRTASNNNTPISISEVGTSGAPRGLFYENDIFYVGDAASSGWMYGDLNFAPVEFSGQLVGVDNPDFIVYSKPWDVDTNERKRIKNIRVLHYPDTRDSVGTSNLGIDWIDTELVTSAGIAPAAFTGDVNIDIAKATARLYRAGTTRQRVFKVTFNGTWTQIVKGLEIDFDQLRG